MDYGHLLKRTWDVAWGNKWLFISGAALILGSWGLGGVVSLAYDPQALFAQAYADLPPGVSAAELRAMEPAFTTIFYASMVVCIPVGLVLFAASRIAVGALIAGAGGAERQPKLPFADAWQVGWERAGRLLGVAVLLSLPGLLIGLVSIMLSNQMGMIDPTDPASATMAMGQSLLSLSLSCLSIVVGIPVTIWLLLSEQAVVREDKKLFESMGHAWTVFLAQPGQVLLLILIQYAITIALVLVVVVPAVFVFFISALVPILFPLICLVGLAVLVLGLFVNTLTYVLWTLAYGEWMEDAGPALPPAEAAAA
ncbi:MAG: hypothetical protein P8Z40_12670 [Chloroflexota bacterium]|jgi:hypothetical protein